MTVFIIKATICPPFFLVVAIRPDDATRIFFWTPNNNTLAIPNQLISVEPKKKSGKKKLLDINEMCCLWFFSLQVINPHIRVFFFFLSNASFGSIVWNFRSYTFSKQSQLRKDNAHNSKRKEDNDLDGVMQMWAALAWKRERHCLIWRRCNANVTLYFDLERNDSDIKMATWYCDMTSFEKFRSDLTLTRQFMWKNNISLPIRILRV